MANEDISTLSLDQCKLKQKILRQKITGCCTRIRKVIDSSLSRREAERLLNEANTFLEETSPINDRILELLDVEEGAQQQEHFLRYGGDVEAMQDAVTAYLASRADEAASEPSEPDNQQEILEARQRAQEAIRLYVEATQAAETAKKAMEDANQLLRSLNGQEDFGEEQNSDLPSTSTYQRLVNTTEAPDDWIDEYCQGREKPFVSKGEYRHSSISVELEVYSGRAVDWFEWIGLYQALVHRTSKSPGEKLAILKRNVRGETADMIYGLGGGEMAYRDALQRLKSTCGSRPVMRAAHLQALERVEPPKGDPASFRRYAEKVRTHLFNLSCIGETGHADIIERLAQKLQIQDRLSWNDGRRGGLEHRSMNQFGVWLCARASAYQNAYSIAADQHQRATHSSKQVQQQVTHAERRYVHANHGDRAVARPRSKVAEDSKAEEHCFKCEGAHRLHTCTFFKALSINDRTTFVIRRGLCFCCLGVRHAARDCREKKTCTIGRCKLPHHPLLHNDADRDVESNHSMDYDEQST